MKAEGRNLENPGESQHPCAQHLPNVRLHASDATVLQELLRPGTGALRLCFAALLLFAWAVPQLPAATTDPSSANPFAWPDAISISRPWAYWWWMGSAVNPADLSRELERYHQAGLGGVHIIPIYGAKGYETQSIEYLGPRWLEMLRHTVTEAHRLGMGVDMTLGTGWCFGGPNITAADANARVVVKTFTVRSGERLSDKIDRRSTQALVAFSNVDRSVELTDRIRDDGTVDWVAESGPWRVYAVSQRPSGRAVKRAAPGGEGPMLNPFFADALQHYLPRFEKALAGYDGPKPRAVYHDSYEYLCDWSPDLFARFEQQHGYRLQTELATMFGEETNDRAARIKSDYRETVSDMMVDNFISPWTTWAHANGFQTRNQAHGSPGNLLDLYAAADIPETEMFNKDRNPLVSKFASSAAHVTGKKLVSSETGTWLAEHFHETLGDLKRLVEELFVSGINHVFYHGACYSPDEAAWPGWLFYASTEMNPRNSIWHDVPALNAYIARCQSILQSGRPDNDILLYWPIYDYWHNAKGMVQPLTVHHTDWLKDQPIGKVAWLLWNRGFTFDYVSDRQLAGAKPKAGKVEMGDGAYRAVVIPPTDHIPLKTMTKLLDLASDGATLIFLERLPGGVPGWGNPEKRRPEFQKLIKKAGPLPTPATGVQETRLGNGRVMVGDLEATLSQAGVNREPLMDHPGLLFVRRADAFGHHYFIVNHGEQPLDQWVTLSTETATAVLMDPLTGRSGLGARRQVGRGQPQVYLQLQPGEAMIVRTIAEGKAEGPLWPYRRVTGQPIEIAGKWQVEFLQGGPKLPASFETAKLASWTESANPDAQSFAGTASYKITFDAPKSATEQWLLDLGTVCQSARVRLNGRELGTLLAAPFQVMLDHVRPQANVLEVEVTNVSANRIRDLDLRGVQWRVFHDINFVSINYGTFDASKWPLEKSGLLGPVTLTAASDWQPGQ